MEESPVYQYPADIVSPLPSPSHRPMREVSLPVARNRGNDINRRRAFTLTGGVVSILHVSINIRIKSIFLSAFSLTE